MRNRRLLHFEKADRAQCTALTKQMLATTHLSLQEAESLGTALEGLTHLGRTGFPTAHLPMVFDTLYCKLERLYDEKIFRPVRRRTVGISWVETDELLLEINVNSSATRESSSANAKSATSSRHLQPRLPAAALAHALPKQALRLRRLGRRVMRTNQ